MERSAYPPDLPGRAAPETRRGPGDRASVLFNRGLVRVILHWEVADLLSRPRRRGGVGYKPFAVEKRRSHRCDVPLNVTYVIVLLVSVLTPDEVCRCGLHK